MATKPTTYKVLLGRVEARVGKKEIAAEAGAADGGDRIELSEAAAAPLIARGILEASAPSPAAAPAAPPAPPPAPPPAK
jgi:hypothetical protein